MFPDYRQEGKKNQFANNEVLDVAARDELPYLNLQFLPSSLQVFKFSI